MLCIFSPYYVINTFIFFTCRELSDPTVRNVVQMTDDNVVVTCDRGAIHSFSYDHCFWSFDSTHPQYASQETVFATMVLPLMDQVFMGCNACLLAYGQTGSGKSYRCIAMIKYSVTNYKIVIF